MFKNIRKCFLEFLEGIFPHCFLDKYCENISFREYPSSVCVICFMWWRCVEKQSCWDVLWFSQDYVKVNWVLQWVLPSVGLIVGFSPINFNDDLLEWSQKDFLQPLWKFTSLSLRISKNKIWIKSMTFRRLHFFSISVICIHLKHAFSSSTELKNFEDKK